MDRKTAKGIAQLLKSWTDSFDSKFTLIEHISSKPLSGFHQWADGLPYEGAFHFNDLTGAGLWILLIDWQSRNNFYVLLFPDSRSVPIAEIHRIDEVDGEQLLHWTYSPIKHDGKNQERKTYFVDVFHSLDVHISVPTTLAETEDFIEELFSLACSRRKADDLDPDRPSIRSGFVEGKKKEKLHLSRERNQELVRQAKLLALQRDGRLKCACCGFDFHAFYGEIGKVFPPTEK